MLLVDLGFHLRWWAWHASKPIHFNGDMENALAWGNRADKLGYLNLYSLVIQNRRKDDYILDYPPLRLAVFTLWAKWLDHVAPEMTPSLTVNELKIPQFLRSLEPRRWRSEDRVNRPLLLFNAATELAAAVAAGLLVWRTVANACLAVTAGMFLWLNPGIWIDSWMRPSWDGWVLPFYLWALFAAVSGRWMISGAIIGVGCMFKGQLLVASPVFVLWPIFRADFLAALRWLGGFVLATALVVSPWMLTHCGDNRRTLDWFVIACLAGIALLTLLLRRLRLVRRLRSPWFEAALAIAAAAAIFSGALYSGTALDWFRVGFQYGVENFPNLEMGGGDCLAGILQQRYNCKTEDVCLILTPHLGHWSSSPISITIGHILAGLYAVTMAAATLGIALQLHWKTSRWLVAATTPWLLFFTLAPQMHERYLVWASARSSSAIRWE